jgi:hypothetical protein
MHAKDFGCDYGGNGQAIKCVNERFPNLDVTSSFTLVVEAID